MSTPRSVDLQPLLPLVDLLKGITTREIKKMMMEVMPILVVPNLKKEELIGQLADHVRSYGSVAEVCKKGSEMFQHGPLVHDPPAV